MSFIWHTFFFDPAYNTLVFFIGILPNGDVGLAIIATVVVVKLLLLPLSVKAVKTQKILREIEPKLRELKEKFKDKREEQARAMMVIYKEAGINPFTSILLLLIQIPIVIALYLVVYKGGGVPLPDINTDLLYGFIVAPSVVSMSFLGMIDITAKSLLLAFAAGVTQYFQIKLAMPELPPRDPNAAPDLKEDFMRNLQTQMRYVLPVIVFIGAYILSAAVALYFFVSNVAGILQELYVRRHR